MELSDSKIRELSRKIMVCRTKLLCNYGFYGLLLMHMQISIGTEFDTAWTDGRDRIWFHPDFLEHLTDKELQYVLLHEVTHAALRHHFRVEGKEREQYNIAADIVVNSNILQAFSGDEYAISLRDYGGVQMHQTPDCKEGCHYTTEEVYAMLMQIYTNGKDNDTADTANNKNANGKAANNRNGNGKAANRKKASDTFVNDKGWDQHISSERISEEDNNKYAAMWQQRILQAAEAVSVWQNTMGRGTLPAFAERILLEMRNPQVNWRQILQDFLQEEVCDYSFVPPDRRMQDSPFFLPDFNEKDYVPKKILFMIDTSGSMSDRRITDCYSEVKGAVDQFNGKLEGWLGFFDAAVIDPIPFTDEEELQIIRPTGGGGTGFQIIFDYIEEKMSEDMPVSLVILTDGYAPFPREDTGDLLPTLWVVTSKEIKPSFGQVVYLPE